MGFSLVSFMSSSAKEDVEVDASIILTVLHPPEHQLTDLKLCLTWKTGVFISLDGLIKVPSKFS